MKLKNVVAPLLLAGGVALTVLTGAPAMASEAACQVQNGCGTLHSVNAVGTPVALDAKRQADIGEVIGYPDEIGDRATSYALVKHDGRGKWTFQDKTFNVGVSGIEGLSAANVSGALTFTYALPVGPAAITTNTYSISLSGLSAVPATVPLKQVAGSEVGSVPFPAWLRPGTYNVGVTLTTTASGVSTTATGTLTITVTGTAVYVPAQPFYTIVYVTKTGGWTSDCVTALGNGLLKDEPCTWGQDPSQMFRFFSATVIGSATTLSTNSVSVPFVASAAQYAVMNVASGGYLEDQSILTAAQTLTPLSDAADSVPGTGRQLDVNGALAGLALWGFGS